jgi:hypothetical protein
MDFSKFQVSDKPKLSFNNCVMKSVNINCESLNGKISADNLSVISESTKSKHNSACDLSEDFDASIDCSKHSDSSYNFSSGMLSQPSEKLISLLQHIIENLTVINPPTHLILGVIFHHHLLNQMLILNLLLIAIQVYHKKKMNQDYLH